MTKDIKKKILDAAMKVVSREKISGTRMYMIAEEAKMSQGNLHYHFATKNDIMTSLLDEVQEKFSALRKNYIDLKNKDAKENIKGLFDQKKDEIMNRKELEYIQFDYWVQGTVNEEIRKKFQNTFNIWRNNVNEILEKGESIEKVNDEIKNMLPFIMVSLMLGGSLQYLIDEGKFDLDKYFNAAEKLIFDEIFQK
ncbi:TetR/AcrR family transcriptional regulator [Clostridium sp. MT-14]|jgi:AcrR family transcriptional regulator|uniref:TetR/AcrR family transcriptional regulator n=1 Tax=Clostridium aromativorans TaxID=2836848 RepID=A0ABS8N3T6_9CLOT|nr:MULTISPECIES: TetR/AcrR family transcriptional regulator [Clostridium]KAA8667871.1 TetR/AcrR family transcriptional regulator [Clostridium sp. HV4-5-A1G]MCC9294476.1 TetR/AcrR family transcriptional regulator [Clostridium aromativorans]CAB1255085.1 TetR family transcriptional regulator [Clostridiaceae bacterium BL-3]